MTTRNNSQKSAPAKGDLKVTPEEAKIENIAPQPKSTNPENIETLSLSEEPIAAPQANPVDKIQTDVREKLSKKSVEENIFVPANPVALEKAAAEVANESGFEINRGTSIGARLMARAQKKV